MKLRLARKVLYRWHRRRRGPEPLERRQSTEAAAVERWAVHRRRWARCQPGPMPRTPAPPRPPSHTQQVTVR